MKIAYYLPEKAFDNSEFQGLGWSAEKIFGKTGIQTRRIAGKEEFALDLALRACEGLFAEHGIERTDVDFLLYCTQSPDTIIPTNACVLQNQLGLRTSIGAFDFNLGCSGFVYGLSLAKALLLSGQARCVLLVTSDTYSKYIHKKDKSNRVIFGDGAAATWIDKDDALKIGDFVFGTDGSGALNLCVKTSGLRYTKIQESRPDSENPSGGISSDNYLYMNGPEILAFTMAEVPKMVHQLLTKSGLKLEDIDHFVFHQANAFLLESLRDKIGIPPEKFHILMRDVGNTVSSTIPIALHQLQRTGALREGQRVMLSGFGVGYSWIATVWTP